MLGTKTKQKNENKARYEELFAACQLKHFA
jgi:hypothetical protein